MPQHSWFSGYEIKKARIYFLIMLEPRRVALLTAGGIDLETLIDDLTGYGAAEPTRSYSYSGDKLTISQELGSIPDGARSDAALKEFGRDLATYVTQRIETLLGT